MSEMHFHNFLFAQNLINDVKKVLKIANGFLYFCPQGLIF